MHVNPLAWDQWIDQHSFKNKENWHLANIDELQAFWLRRENHDIDRKLQSSFRHSVIPVYHIILIRSKIEPRVINSFNLSTWHGMVINNFTCFVNKWILCKNNVNQVRIVWHADSLGLWVQWPGFTNLLRLGIQWSSQISSLLIVSSPVRTPGGGGVLSQKYVLRIPSVS